MDRNGQDDGKHSRMQEQRGYSPLSERSQSSPRVPVQLPEVQHTLFSQEESISSHWLVPTNLGTYSLPQPLHQSEGPENIQ